MAACILTLRLKSMHVSTIEELKIKARVLTAVACTRPALARAFFEATNS